MGRSLHQRALPQHELNNGTLKINPCAEARPRNHGPGCERPCLKNFWKRYFSSITLFGPQSGFSENFIWLFLSHRYSIYGSDSWFVYPVLSARLARLDLEKKLKSRDVLLNSGHETPSMAIYCLFLFRDYRVLRHSLCYTRSIRKLFDLLSLLSGDHESRRRSAKDV